MIEQEKLASIGRYYHHNIATSAVIFKTSATEAMNTSSSSSDYQGAEIVFCVLNGVALLVCLAAAILVVALRLHKKIVYRLSLYQVLAGIALATVETLQIMFLNYDKAPLVYARLCIAIGFFVLYAQWMKVFFAMWVTFHLFCFAVLYKNLKKLEALYVVTSLLVPALIAVVPLITRSYHYAPPGCFINKNNNTVTDEIVKIEWFILWNGSALTILLVASIAMVVMVITLTYRVCLRLKSEPISDGDQFWKALKQLLPLAAFPILFFIFAIPGLIYGMYLSINSTINNGALLAASVCIAMWGIASGASLIIHISVARLCCRNEKKRPLDAVHVDGSKLQPLLSNDLTLEEESCVNVNISSITHFSLPEESNAEDKL